ncbi:MAG: hypothetical protein M1822_007126 [Bathelium mastoideum]|nr:MAG: hypothetical protein M1822_007126 [Bathelium mastoideum]
MATKGFDDLLDFLLDEVAFRGFQGASVNDFTRLVAKFYQESDDATSRPQSAPSTTASGSPATDEALLRRVWKWLTSHPDISVGEDGEGDGLSYDEVKTQECDNAETGTLRDVPSQSPPSTLDQEPDASSALATSDSDPKSARQSKHASQHSRNNSATEHEQVSNRAADTGASNAAPASAVGSAEKPDRRGLQIYATQERIWRALAGHDVDWRRVPKMELDLLSIIAANGPEGILQSTLVQLSGQDKRSVPHRTDRLHACGYIRKSKVLAKSCHTSLCVHKRFIQLDRDEPKDHASDEIETYAILKDGIVSYDEMLKSVFSLLRAHNNIMTLGDLRKCLGFRPKAHQSRLFYRMATRLEKMGCLQRVAAKAADNGSGERRFRCLKLLREPNDDDYREFMKFGRKQDKEVSEPSQELEPSQDNQGSMEDFFADDDDDDASTVRVPPQWTPDIPHANFLYNLIDSSGPQGLTSKEIRFRAVGTFWRRSLDVSLGRLSDAWNITQPPHLRHLAIIRDTVQMAKSSQYIYRTFHNFQKAVDAGQAEWEAVIPPEVSTSKKGAEKDMSSTAPDVDELGFSTIPEKQFASSSGVSTLSECERQAKIPKQGLFHTDPVLKVSEDGAVCVDWGSKRILAKSRHWTQDDISSTLPQIRSKGQKGQNARGAIEVRKRKVLGRPRIPNGPTDRKEARARAEAEEGTVSSLSKRKSRRISQGETEPAAKRLRTAGPSLHPISVPLSPHEPGGGETRDSDLEMQDQSQQQTSSGQIESIEQLSGPGSRKRKRPKEDVPLMTAGPYNDPLSKVLINPIGSEKPPKKPRRGRPPKSMVIVVKIGHSRQSVWSELLSSETSADIETLGDPVTRTNGSSSMVPESSNGIGTVTVLGEESRNSMADVDERNTAHSPVDSRLSEPAVSKELNDPSEMMQSPHTPRGAGSSQQPSFIEPASAPSTIVEQESGVEPSPTYTLRRSVRPVTAASRNSYKISKKGSKRTTAQSRVNQKSRLADEISPQSAPQEDKIGEEIVVSRTAGPAILDAEIPGSVDDSLRAEQTDSAEKQQSDTGHPLKDPHMEEENKESSQQPDSGAMATAIVTRPDIDCAQRDDHEPAAQLHTTIENEESDDFAQAEKDDSVLLDVSRQDDRPVEEHTPATRKRKGRASYGKKRGIAISEGYVSLSRAKTIIEIIRQAGGVFPGGNAIYYPFMTAWGDSHDGTLPDRRTLHRVLKNLVEQARLHKVVFAFKDDTGAVVTRHVLVLPEEELDSEKVREIQKRIRDAHPFQFLPPGVTVSDELKERMKRTLRGSFEPVAPEDVPAQRATSRTTTTPDIPSTADGTPTVNGTPTANEASELQRPGENRATASMKLVGTPHKSPSARFLADDSVTVNRLFPEPSSALKSGPKKPKTTSNRPRKSAEGTSRGRGRSSAPSRRPAPDSQEHRSALYKRALDRLRTRQASGSNIASQLRRDTYRANLSAFGDKLIFINKGPATFDPDYAITQVFTIMDPAQEFYANIGTFSTKSNVVKHARLELWQNLDKQEAFEQDMPYDIQDVLLRGQLHAKNSAPHWGDRVDNATDRLNHELMLTWKWEESILLDKDWEHTHGDRKLRAIRFINHNLPNPHVAQLSRRIEIDRTDAESEHSISEDDNAVTVPTSDRLSLKSGAVHQLHPSSKPKPGAWQDTRLSSVPDSWQWSPSNLNPTWPGVPPPQAVQGVKGVLVPARKTGDLGPKRRSRGRVKHGSPKGPQLDQVEDVSPNSVSRTERSGYRDFYRPGVKLDTVEKRTLLVAIAVVRSLTSGVEQKETNWGLVAQACRYMHDGLTLRKCWTSLRQRTKRMTDEFQEQFQARFLTAYERGELPVLDYSNLENFDWAWLVDWAKKVCTDDSTMDQTKLERLPPGGRRVVIQHHDISKPVYDALFSEKFFSNVASAPYRDALVNRSVFLSPLNAGSTVHPLSPGWQRNYTQPPILDVAKSWIRANCLTPSATFDSKAASTKLRQLPHETIKAALDSMIADKVLRPVKKNRILPERNFDLTESFMSSFRRPLELQDFQAAARYKQRLDLTFKEDDADGTEDGSSQGATPGTMVLPLANDGCVLAVLNLVAGDYARLEAHLPPTTDDINAPDPKLSKWGLVAPGYQTQQMDRKKLNFDVEILPTEKYTYGNPIKEQLAAKQVCTPPGSEFLADNLVTPLWYDINGDFIPDIWHMVLVSILATIISRPGAGVNTIVACCKGNLESQDALLCLQWCEEAGVLRRIGSGWTTNDWWWMVLADDLGMETNKEKRINAGLSDTLPDE